MKILTTITLSIFIASIFLLVVACDSGLDPSVKKSLEDAGETVGIEIPWPHYLSPGYEIQNVTVDGKDNVMLMIANNESKIIELEIMWRPQGIIPYRIDINKPTTEINGITAQILRSDEKIWLVWNWYPERYKPGLIIVELFVPKDFSIEELTKIAGSISWD